MSGAAAFLGRFHPLLVHFPIAFLLLAGLVELIAARRRERAPWLAAAQVPLLALAALSAAAAAGAGYLLGRTGGYAGATFERHLQLGILVAVTAAATAIAAWHRRRSGGSGTPLVRICFAVTLIALVGAGHLGATLTHGDGYLTDHAPAPVRTLIARAFGTSTAASYTGPAERAPVYPTLVQPILRRHCLDCHTSGAPRGGLVLDTPDAILKGGDHGAAVVPGRALSSELVRRVWLPREHADVMPPAVRRPLPAADAAILRWWVDSGASFDRPLADVEIPPEILPALEARLGPIARGGPSIPSIALPPLDTVKIDAVRQPGLDIRPIADGSPFVEVRFTTRTAGADDARVARLSAIAPHVLWLTLADTAVTDAVAPSIAALPNLTRLDLSRTATTDAGLQALGPLAQLESLNLYGTRVTDAGIARLGALPRLRRVYLWQTGVTPEGIEKLKAAAPKLEIVAGDAP